MQYDDVVKDNECTLLSLAQKVSEYMIKVDQCQLELANTFRLASVMGAFDGQVQITYVGNDA